MATEQGLPRIFHASRLAAMVPPSFRLPAFGVTLAVLVLALAWSARATSSSPPIEAASDKTLVLDGSFVHDVGKLQLHVTNWGLLGSRPSRPSGYFEAPSGRWPGANGVDHLWAAGLWIGARLDGEPRVSTGQFQAELMPTSDPLDIPYVLGEGMEAARRYPDPGFDDDADGREDEDPWNGRDDDDDGRVDEDGAGIGDQHFRAEYADTNPTIFIDHVALGVEIVQQTFQWSHPACDDFIGLDFTIRNSGENVLREVFLGFLADVEILATELQGEFTDDLAGFLERDVVGPTGETVFVRVAYGWDCPDDGDPNKGYLGVVLLGHTTDEQGERAPLEVGLRGFQMVSGTRSFENGGEPRSDAERYELMSRDERDQPPADCAQTDDIRLLLSSGPFPTFAPGDELRYQLAFVAGADLPALLQNAAAAVLTHRGETFDRDDDPATGIDGRETRVYWLPPPDLVVPAISATLRTQSVASGVRIDVRAHGATADRLVLRRTAGGRGRVWPLAGGGVSDGTSVSTSVLDDDAMDGLRRYELVWRDGDLEHRIAETSFEPPLSTPQWRVASNPVTSSVRVELELPRGDRVSVRVYDARGRHVRTLVEGFLPSGAHALPWDGTDVAGRSVGRGVYHLRLRTSAHVRSCTVTLTR